MREPRDDWVCLDARRHGVVLLRPLAQALALAAVGAFLVASAWPLPVGGALLLAVGALLFLRAVWRWERTRVVVTTDKLYVVSGTMRRRASAVRLERVGAVEIEQSLLGRVLGYGTVVAGPLEIEYVPQARRVYHLVESLCG
jgi:uncharacterized membrane protein YdbT with pleckstrin-like domain